MRHHDLLIVGTGSGNSVVDDAFDGQDVGIVEQGTFGGTCINVGCIPSKMFVHTADLANTARDSARFGLDAHIDKVRWVDIRDRIFGRIDPIVTSGRDAPREHGVNTTYYAEQARFVGQRRLRLDSGEEVDADQIVVAAGGRFVVPDIPGLDDVEVHTSDTVMRIDALPESMVIVGGGAIAAEMAHVFGAFGTRVTIVARSRRLLGTEDDDVSERFTEVAGTRWDVRSMRVVARAEAAGPGVRLHLADAFGRPDPVPAEGELLLVATGRTPNSDRLDVAAGGIVTHADGRIVVDEYQRTTAPGVFALGDTCNTWELKHVANHEARVVRHNLLHPHDLVAADHRYVPHAVFTDPQVAAVGRTEAELIESGTTYVAATHPYRDVAYGWALEDTSGFVKVLAEPSTGRLLGAHIIGPDASALLQPLIQAMSFEQPAPEVARGQYWIHPSLPEVVENALLELPLD